MLVPYCPQTCVQRNAASHPPCKQPKVRRLAGFVLLVGASMKQVDGFSAPAGALADWGPQTKAPHAGVALPADIDKTARAHPHQPKQEQHRRAGKLWLAADCSALQSTSTLPKSRVRWLLKCSSYESWLQDKRSPARSSLQIATKLCRWYGR